MSNNPLDDAGNGIQNLGHTAANWLQDAFRPAGGGQGGKYTFSPAELESQIKRYQDILDNIAEDQRDVRSITAVRSPAPDIASQDVTEAIRNCGKALLIKNEHSMRYVEHQIAKLRAVLAQYQAQEHHAATQLRRIDRSR
jgi:hypothetical protein